MLAKSSQQEQNSGVLVSAEQITTVVTVLGAVATLLGGMLTLLFFFQRRTEARMDRFEEQILELRRDMNERFLHMDNRFQHIDERLTVLHQAITDNSVAIARLEGTRMGLSLGTKLHTRN